MCSIMCRIVKSTALLIVSFNKKIQAKTFAASAPARVTYPYTCGVTFVR